MEMDLGVVREEIRSGYDIYIYIQIFNKNVQNGIKMKYLMLCY